MSRRERFSTGMRMREKLAANLTDARTRLNRHPTVKRQSGFVMMCTLAPTQGERAVVAALSLDKSGLSPNRQSLCEKAQHGPDCERLVSATKRLV